MSYISAYDNHVPKPKGIALTIGLHAIVLGALVAMPGIEIIPKDENLVEAVLITAMEPLKEKPEEQKPEIQVPREQKVQIPVEPFEKLPPASDTSLLKFVESGEIAFGGSGESMDIPIEPADVIQRNPDPVTIVAKLDPRYTKQFQPRYPSGLLRLDLEGEVSVRVLVGVDGRAKDIQLISSPRSEFWESTRRHALRKWRFQPATEDGKPVESWINLKVQFQIE